MTSISGSEVAKLVLGYLKDCRLEKAWLEFMKSSKYLKEQYEHFKSGLNISTLHPNSKKLLDFLKEYLEISDIVHTHFNDHYACGGSKQEVPDLHTVTAKLRYILNTKLAKHDGGSHAVKSHATRKRAFAAMNCHEDSSGDDESLSPEATKVQNLPGYCPPKKRQKMIDELPELVISSSACEDAKDDKTPIKPLNQYSEPAPPKSTSKLLTKHNSGLNNDVSMSFEMLSEIMLENPEIQNVLVKNINSGVASNNSAIDNNRTLQEQLDQAMEGILELTEQNPVYDMVVDQFIDAASSQFQPEENFETQSSSTPNKSSENEETVAEQEPSEVNTPQNESIKQRLRPRKPNSSTLNDSKEEKRKKSNKAIEVISNEYVGTLPESAMQSSGSEASIIYIKSDSEETVTTTSTQQQLQYQPGKTQLILTQDPQTQALILTQVPIAAESMQLTQAVDTLQTPVLNNMPIYIDSFMPNTFYVDSQGMITNASGLEQNQITISADVNQCQLTQNVVEPERNRIIVVNGDDPTNENNTAAQVEEQPTKENQPPVVENPQPKSNTISLFPFLSQAVDQKAATPKQLIKPNVPSSSRSLSTPRNKNPHVRVLDFNTPARFHLTKIAELKNESLHTETPQNRSVTSSLPSSAPPKMNSVQDTRTTEKKLSFCNEESSSLDADIPFSNEHDEDTVISVGDETPKVRKKHRKACVRTLSAHKEINTEESQQRLKRLEKTKKKICNEDENSGASDKVETKKTTGTDDAMLKWQQARMVATNPNLFEQNLREQNSKKQEIEQTMGQNKRKPRRTRKNAPTKSKTKASTKKAASESIANTSLNSTFDSESMNNTQLKLEAKMLEENLQSAKKVTPPKPTTVTKSKRKTPVMQIKLPQSPKVKKELKRLKSEKKLATAAEKNKLETVAEVHTTDSTDKSNTLVSEEAQKPAAIPVTAQNTSDDLEVAENLLKMQEVILQQEREQNLKKLAEQQAAKETPLKDAEASSSKPQQTNNDFETPVVKVTSVDPILSGIYPNPQSVMKNPNLSMASLLETPFKFDSSVMIPKTPGLFNLPPQLDTPMLKQIENIMDDSLFKNPQFPTPTFPITPGNILTPFKDIFSPRSDQEIVYGAANRPTDYSSSSSYYKPDESDGVDKQIQESVRSSRGNSGVYSSDELDSGQKQNSMHEEDDLDTTSYRNDSQLESSSSSSSSSSDDSDSDSSDSSSSSNSSTNSPVKEPISQNEMKSAEDYDTEIKSHIVSTAQAGIAQNILLERPESPIKDREAENAKAQADLIEKRLRVQERLRVNQQKNPEKFAKPKPTQKIRNLAQHRHERLRTAPIIRSPSKRKLAQPKKVISLSSQQVYSTEVSTTKTLPIPEASSDNAVIDASDVSLNQGATENKVDAKTNVDEESVDAIECHLKTQLKGSAEPPVGNESSTKDAEKLTTDRLIEMLEDKREQIAAKRSPVKTKSIKEIQALPMKKITRARPKNIIDEPSTSKVQKASKSKTVRVENTKEEAKPKIVANQRLVSTSIQEKVSIKPDSNISSSGTNVIQTLTTPAKAQRIRDIFGDLTDLETPVKSAPTESKPIDSGTFVKPAEAKQTPISSTTEQKEVREAQPSPKKSKTPVKQCIAKEDEISSNTNFDGELSYDEYTDSEGEEDDDDYEDDFETKLFEGYHKEYCEPEKFIKSTQNILLKYNKVYKLIANGIERRICIHNEELLFTQEPKSTVTTKGASHSKKQQSSTKNKCIEEASSSSNTELAFGKPLQTSTPSPTNKPIIPKINIKHKDKTPSKAQKPAIISEKNANIKFSDEEIDKLLVTLHPSEIGQ